MKRRFFLKAGLSIGAGTMLAGLTGCSDPLGITPDSELSDEFLATEGIESVLMSAYSNIQYNAFDGANKMYVSEWPTDIMWETGGGLNGHAVLYINYTWDPSHGWLGGFWNSSYQSIRDANIVLENIDDADVASEDKDIIRAEAKFARATAYFFLYNWFGPTPLITSSDPELEPSRASEEEIVGFIENEYLESTSGLPEQRSSEEKGRATVGAALGMLAKLYLNTKQWQKCADTSAQIMNMGIYDLYPEYPAMFRVENENNDEFIWVHNCINQSGLGNVLPPASFPPSYPTPGSHENWAAQVRLRDDFVNSFEEGDERREPVITEYTDQDGEHIVLLGDDNSRSFKYWPDPNANGRWTGNDIPEIRYADILLSRAEAINELHGPTQEAIDLVNMIRDRAGLDGVSLSDFASSQDLRDHILKERGWEFYHEAKRREDMIRHGILISNAQERGVNAQEHHVLFPIPQSEIDANPNLEQNPGY